MLLLVCVMAWSTHHEGISAQRTLIRLLHVDFLSQYRVVTGWVRDRGGTHWWESRWCESNEAKSNACTCANGIFTFLGRSSRTESRSQDCHECGFLKAHRRNKVAVASEGQSVRYRNVTRASRQIHDGQEPRRYCSNRLGETCSSSDDHERVLSWSDRSNSIAVDESDGKEPK